MMKIDLGRLSERQRQAWIMRYLYRWRLRQIALKLGINASSVSRMLLRAQVRAGLPRQPNLRVIRTKPRLTRVRSLATVSENRHEEQRE